MDKAFETALEATEIMYELERQLNSLPYNMDLYKMRLNIKRMVTELSQLEVLARNSHTNSKYRVEYSEKREEIQNAIKQLDNFMLIARLMA